MMKPIVVIALVAAAAAGCATLQTAGAHSTEEMLSAAGFHLEPADTPEKRADLHLPPARELLPEGRRDGNTRYVYRDPLVCKCRYVGGEPEYRRYEQLRQRRSDAGRSASRWGWGPGWSFGDWAPWQNPGYVWP